MPARDELQTNDLDSLEDTRIRVVISGPGVDLAEAPDDRPTARHEIAEPDDLIEISATLIRLAPGLWRGEKMYAEDAMAVFSVADPPRALRPLHKIVLYYRDHDGRFRPFKAHHSYTFRFTPDGEFFDIRGVGVLAHDAQSQ